MIRNFSDHAANERTFLAWARTAVAIMAFGFVVERFDIFLRLVGGPTRHVGRLLDARLGEPVGLGMIGAGVAIVFVAALRFVRTGRQIDDPDSHLGPGARLDLALAALLLLLGCALVAYLAISLGANG